MRTQDKDQANAIRRASPLHGAARSALWRSLGGLDDTGRFPMTNWKYLEVR